MRSLAAACLLWLASVNPVHADGIAWTDDIDEAFRTAVDRGAPVMVDVWAVWCVPCKEMEETTYRDARVRAALEDVVPLKVDADTQTIFVERYRVQAFPETLFLDKIGREIGRRAGYVGPDELLGFLRVLREGYPAYASWSEGDERDETRVAVGEMMAEFGSRGRAANVLSETVRKAQKDPDSLPEPLRFRLARALIASGEAKDAASILHRLSSDGSTRDLQETSLRTLAALRSIRGLKALARAAQERLDREFPDSPAGGS